MIRIPKGCLKVVSYSGANDVHLVELPDGPNKGKYYYKTPMKTKENGPSEVVLAQGLVSHWGDKYFLPLLKGDNEHKFSGAATATFAYDEDKRRFGIASTDFSQVDRPKFSAYKILGEPPRDKPHSIETILVAIEKHAIDKKIDLTDDNRRDLRAGLLLEVALQVLTMDRDRHTGNMEFFYPNDEHPRIDKVPIYDNERTFTITQSDKRGFKLHITDKTLDLEGQENRTAVLKEMVAAMEEFRREYPDHPMLKAYQSLLTTNIKQDIIETFNKNLESENIPPIQGDQLSKKDVKNINNACGSEFVWWDIGRMADSFERQQQAILDYQEELRETQTQNLLGLRNDETITNPSYSFNNQEFAEEDGLVPEA